MFTFLSKIQVLAFLFQVDPSPTPVSVLSFWQLFVYILTAVCLHFVSCLFTFLSFCKQTADFSVFSCLFTFFQVLTFLNEVDPSPTPVPVLSFCKQTADFVYIFQLFVYILSAVCLHFVSCLFTFLSFCKQTADFVYIFSAVCLQFSCLFTFSQFL